MAATIWVGTLHLWFERDPDTVARPLAGRQLALWEPGGSEELEASVEHMRRTNPEWDLMARMFATLAFANLAMRDEKLRPRYLAAIDYVIERTLQDIDRGGHHHFLLSYSKERAFNDADGRSLFVDGELALMITAR